MSGIHKVFETSFTPGVEKIDNSYYPVVQMVSNIFPSRKTLYEFPLENEKIALSFARWFADTEKEIYSQSVTSALKGMGNLR